MAYKVGVIGAMGKMGKEVVKAVIADGDCELVCAVDVMNVGENIYSNVNIQSDLKGALLSQAPDIVVDFTQPSSILENIKLYLDLGIKSVIGTTGLSASDLALIEKLVKEKNTGCFIAPNFSTGAILMMKFAALASKYFNNAEILEFHHNQKKDAPSGTAIKTAQMMASVNSNLKSGNVDEVELIAGARGAEFNNENDGGKIAIHAIRMPGFVASQEVVFGSAGQTLKIRHDSIDRACYMGGVLMALKHVAKNNNYTYGLENIL